MTFFESILKTFYKNPNLLDSRELEEYYVSLKGKIINRNPPEELEFDRLYSNIGDVMVKILSRHSHYIHDFEANEKNRSLLLNLVYWEPESILSESWNKADSEEAWESHLQSTDEDSLLYLCFFLWHGGKIRGLSYIEKNDNFLKRHLDHLVLIRDFAPAFFFKGMVLKYGIRYMDRCEIEEAELLLRKASDRGIGSANVELEHLHIHKRLVV